MRIGIPKREQLEHEETEFPLLWVTTLPKDTVYSNLGSKRLGGGWGQGLGAGRSAQRTTPTYVLGGEEGHALGHLVRKAQQVLQV